MESTLTLNWTWSGWQEQLAKEPPLNNWTVLTRQDLQTQIQQEPLDDARTIFVDFFPDELTQEAWEQIKTHARKMVFLPPLITLPAQVGAQKQKPLLWVDTPQKNLPPVDWIQQDKNLQGLCRLWPIPAAALAKIFDVRQAENQTDICESLNSPLWVLAVNDAQTEHALYQVARQYGIRVAYWERAYSSPMRYMAGYEHPFDTLQDKSLRARLKRVRETPPAPAQVPQKISLAQVRETLGYARLGLGAGAYPWVMRPEATLATQTLPQDFTHKLTLPQTSMVICAGIRTLGKKQNETPAQALTERLWSVLLTEIFSLPTDHAAQRWAAAYAAQPHLCASITRLLLRQANGWELRNIVFVVLFNIFTLEIFDATAKKLLQDIRELEPRWFDYPDLQPEQWIQKALMDACWESANPTASETEAPSACKDLWAYRAVTLWRQKNAEQAAQALRKAIAEKSITRLGWRIMLPHALEAGGEVFGEALTAAIAEVGAEHAVFYAMEGKWGMPADAAWGKAHAGELAQMVTALEKNPNENGHWSDRRFYLLALTQKAPEAAAKYQSEEIYRRNAHAGLLLAFSAMIAGQEKTGVEILKAIDPGALPGFGMALHATLAMRAGMAERGHGTLTALMQAEPAFWQTTPMDIRAADKWMLAGIIGRATHDAEMTKRATERLEGPLWKDKLAVVKNAPSSLTPESLTHELREWILNDI